MKEPKYIVVVGTSAGGRGALAELVTQLPQHLDTAIFIVMHLSNTEIGNFLSSRLQRYTSIPCSLAEEGRQIAAGHIYVAPIDYHLIIKKGYMKVTNGPRENRWRPSIDVLFRSAAATYGERVIGIVLTGMLDDGTAGMLAIKKSGGTCIVQDPEEAEYPDMPNSVLQNMQADYVLPLSQMGFILADLVKHKELKGIPVPPEVTMEAAIAEKAVMGINEVNQLGKQTLYTCPDCGGVLWEIKEHDFHRYRCHAGHAYTQQDLLKRQTENLENTLWVALRLMEERENLLRKIGEEERRKGFSTLSQTHEQRADELKVHIQVLKKELFKLKEN